jgi:hypothetical protein
MHTDPALLGLLALGEDVGTEDDRLHAQTCPGCAGELSQLQRLATLGRSVSAETTMITPRQEVWARIRDELAFDLTREPPKVTRFVDATPAAKAASTNALRSPPAVIEASPARSSYGSEDQLMARAQLTPVGAFWSGASGTAELATDERGRRLLQVGLQADLPTFGVRQAWLIDRDDPSLRQTLGILDGTHGLWTVDHSIDLEKYAILDISQQGAGETEYSGQTIVRGELALVN